MSPTSRFMAPIAAALLISVGNADAGIIFSSTQTGHELTTNSNVTIHETVDASPATSIDFIDGARLTVMLEWLLLPAASRNDLTATINLDYTPLSGDNDLVFGLHDGTNVTAWLRADNSDGLWVSREGLWKNDLDVSQLSGNGGGKVGLGPVDPIELVYGIPDGGGDTTLSATELDTNGALTTTNFSFINNPLNGDSPLTLFLARGDSTEDYRINEISVNIDEAGAAMHAVPEPSTMALYLIGLLGISVHGRFRQQR